jgi:hypothetical protein
MKNILWIVISVLSFLSCSKENSHIKIVQQYYDGLNAGNYMKTSHVLSNQFIMRENESNYEVAFSPEEFHNWFQWDSVFNPTYTVTDLHLKNDTVFAQITKKCDRIMLLHDEPLSNLAYFEISDGKIKAINRYKYTNANWDKWMKNRNEFLQFCNSELRELGDFMNAQNVDMALIYAKAIAIYTHYKEHKISFDQSNNPDVTLRSIHKGFDDFDTPMAEYYLYFNGDADSILIDKEYGGEAIDPSDYDEYNIPGNALAALYSYWAGVGIIHYVEKNETSLVVYKCVFYEEDVVKENADQPCFKYEKFRVYAYL